MGFLLSGGIHHGNMTFTAPLHLLIKGIHKQKQLTSLRVLAAELVIKQRGATQSHNTMRGSNGRQSLVPKCVRRLCSYLVFETVSAVFQQHRWTPHESSITKKPASDVPPVDLHLCA